MGEMQNSDSDSENECFESAAESLDEEEEEKMTSERKSKGIKSSPNRESEVAEPVVSKNDTVDIGDEDAESNVLQYRRRPERVKRSSSRGSTGKVVPPKKSPANDSFFSADSITQPDVFFQDITSNLSRNINKSLNTIQQKSSNVKDLILSSLPITSVHESEGFSYDDNKYVSSGSADSNVVNRETLENEFSYDSHSKELSESVPCEPVNTDIKESFNTDKLVEKNTKVEAEASTVKESKSADVMKEVLGKEVSQRSSTEEAVSKEILSQIALNHKSSSLNVTSVEVKGLIKDNETSLGEISIYKPVDDVKTSNGTTDADEIPESKNFITDKLEDPEVPCEGIGDKEDKVINSTDLESVIHDEPSGDWDDSDLPDINVEEGHFEPPMENKIDSECNVEELKTALKNIVNDDSQNLTESRCKSPEPEAVTEDVKGDSNDGWDDFDFSDVEDDTSKTENRVSDFESERSNEGGAGKFNMENVTPEKKPQPLVLKELRVRDRRNKKEEPERKEDSVVRGECDAVNTNKKCVTTMEDDWGWGEETSTDDTEEWPGWENFGQKQEPKQEERQGNWNLGSWGMNMLLNKATAVTQGISNVLEAGLGAPDPETLARMEKLERERLREAGIEPEKEEPPKKNSLTDVNLFPTFGLTDLVAGVTSKIVEHSKIQELGSKVISGGLDTLENFGKKTMEVLQDGDPGLRHKRALLSGPQKPVLSQILREAREKADMELKKVEEKELAKKCHFETLFDDFQGMVHLEALEMLSRLCELKLEQTRSAMNAEEKEDLDGILEEVEQLCALDEYDADFKTSVTDFKMALSQAVQPLKDEISVNTIIEIHQKVCIWLDSSAEGSPSPVIIHQKVVSTLAELTAAIVHQFHKGGELLSVKECRKTVEEVDALSRLTSLLCMEISRICEKFTSLVSDKCENKLSATDIKLLHDKIKTGMQNSTSYIRHAFKLLLPVLQVGAAT